MEIQLKFDGISNPRDEGGGGLSTSVSVRAPRGLVLIKNGRGYFKDLKGEVFGRLTVLGVTKLRKYRCMVWRCRCECGVEIEAVSSNLMRGNTTSCGCFNKERVRESNSRRKGKNHPGWKGGKRIGKRGYIILFMPEHPDSDSRGYIYEHRLIMERKLGRPLGPKEVVHHIDGDPANNAPENLDLFANQARHKAHHHNLAKQAADNI